MAYLFSQGVTAGCTIRYGENQGQPSYEPPHERWYTDMSGEWQDKLAQNIGTTTWIEFTVTDPISGYEIPFDHCIAEGGVGSFELSVPVTTMGASYQIADWTLQIRRDCYAELHDILTMNMSTWREREVNAYLWIMGAPDKLPLYKWQVADLVKGTDPRLILTDRRSRLLRTEMHADGIEIPTATDWVETTEITDYDDGDGFTPTFDTDYLKIWRSRCEIGHWTITFTDDSGSFDVDGPGIEL